MNKKEIIGEVYLTLGSGLLVGGAGSYAANQFSEKQLKIIEALALIYIVIGSNLKNQAGG